MELSLVAYPYKTAGQGFSVAPLHMDILINYDANTKSGYGLRLIRTTKYGNAVDCYFVKYEDNVVTSISEPISTSCFRPPFKLDLSMEGGKIRAIGSTLKPYARDKYGPEVVDDFDISTDIIPFEHGGFGIEFNGGAKTLIKELTVKAKNINKP